MRIDNLTLENFKGFVRREFQFHPQFNLLVGENGSGKTSLLDALSVAAGSWFLGIRGYDSRHIRPEDLRLQPFPRQDQTYFWELQFPCAVTAGGHVNGHPLQWRRAIQTPRGRTTSAEANEIKNLAAQHDDWVRRGEDVTLPLISYYGTGRLWDVPRKQAQVDPDKGLKLEKVSRLNGYRNSVDPRLAVDMLVTWFARQAWAAYRQGAQTAGFSAVQAALIKNVQGAHDVSFDPQLGEMVVDFGEYRQPFNNLSDGQRCMLALVGDLAQKAATLNPHLGADILSQTPGVVLIDELDLHLHPKWQRHVVENLRTTFPKLQFFCTTHSPFLIQSLRSGEELILLDGQPLAHLGNKSVEEIARGVQGVSNPQMAARYEDMREAARGYLETLEFASQAPQEKLAEYQTRLAAAIGPYADNPAFQAFLEMKRVAKLGE